MGKTVQNLRKGSKEPSSGVKAERPSSKGPPSESPKKVHFESKPDGPKRDWRKKKGFNEKHGKVPKPKPVEEDAEDDEEGEEDAMDEAVDDEEVAEDKQEKRPKTKKSFPEILLSNLADFKSVYLLALDKVGNKEYNELNADWVASRIHRGKNCMEVAKEVFKDGELSELSSKIIPASHALLFTSRPHEQVQSFFALSRPCYARKGYVAEETITLPKGFVMPCPLSMEGQLFKLQVQVQPSVEAKELTLIAPYTVAIKGQPLTADQARVLTLLGRKIGELKVNLVAKWDGSYEEY